MIGRAGSMIGSGGAFANQLSLGGKIRPNWVLVCAMLIGASRFACPIRDTTRWDPTRAGRRTSVRRRGRGRRGQSRRDETVDGGAALNGCVAPCGAAPLAGGRFPCDWAACTCCVRSRTHRPNVSLMAAEPASDSVHGGSLPSGKVKVIEEAPRNCRSNVWIAFGSSVQSMLWSWPIACMVHGVFSPICITTVICVLGGIDQSGLLAENAVSVPPMSKRIDSRRLSVGLVLPTPQTAPPVSPLPLNASQAPA